MFEKAGGARTQTVEPPDHEKASKTKKQNQLTANSKGYKERVLADGIPNKKAGLFPPDDPFLTELTNTEGLKPFEKHIPGDVDPYELCKRGGWATGAIAAENGLDLRLFYKDKEEDPFCDDDPDTFGTVVGAARLGDQAAIGHGLWETAHGGAIETLLDESTAELAKFAFAPVSVTGEASFKFKQVVPLHTTLRIDCKITKMQKHKCWVSGTLSLPGSSTVLATCDASLFDMQLTLKTRH